jgi:hydroxyacylglutathione hydrolase
MEELADGVFHLQCMPVLPWALNAYLIEDVLIDAGTRRSGGRLLKQIGDRKLSAHAHPDHQGSSHEISERRGIPYLVSEVDAPDAEDPTLIPDNQPNHPVTSLLFRLFTGPGHPVDRRLSEGDQVGGFEVLETPGHSPGHVAFWRASDKTLIIGDVLTNQDQLTGSAGLHEPKSFFTTDPERNRESARRLVALEPELVCFGHGKPVRDPGKLAAFVAKLG